MKYYVKLYEKCQSTWVTILGPVNYEVALSFWNNHTDNGKKNSNRIHGDYYKIVTEEQNEIIIVRQKSRKK